MTFNAALFDLDGTLVDSLPGIAWAAQAAVDSVMPGSRLPPLRPFIGPPIDKIFRAALDETDGKIISALTAAFRKLYNDQGWRRSELYPDTLPLLRLLKASGWKLGVVTNKPLIPTRNILVHLGLSPFLDVVVTPDSRIPAFVDKTEALRSLILDGCFNPPTSIFVGDSEDDASAAKHCCIKFYHASYGYGSVILNSDQDSIVSISELSNHLTGSSVSR